MSAKTNTHSKVASTHTIQSDNGNHDDVRPTSEGTVSPMLHTALFRGLSSCHLLRGAVSQSTLSRHALGHAVAPWVPVTELMTAADAALVVTNLSMVLPRSVRHHPDVPAIFEQDGQQQVRQRPPSHPDTADSARAEQQPFALLRTLALSDPRRGRWAAPAVDRVLAPVLVNAPSLQCLQLRNLRSFDHSMLAFFAIPATCVRFENTLAARIRYLHAEATRRCHRRPCRGAEPNHLHADSSDGHARSPHPGGPARRCFVDGLSGGSPAATPSRRRSLSTQRSCSVDVDSDDADQHSTLLHTVIPSLLEMVPRITSLDCRGTALDPHVGSSLLLGRGSLRSVVAPAQAIGDIVEGAGPALAFCSASSTHRDRHAPGHPQSHASSPQTMARTAAAAFLALCPTLPPSHNATRSDSHNTEVGIHDSRNTFGNQEERHNAPHQSHHSLHDDVLRSESSGTVDVELSETTRRAHVTLRQDSAVSRIMTALGLSTSPWLHLTKLSLTPSSETADMTDGLTAAAIPPRFYEDPLMLESIASLPLACPALTALRIDCGWEHRYDDHHLWSLRFTRSVDRLWPALLAVPRTTTTAPASTSGCDPGEFAVVKPHGADAPAGSHHCGASDATTATDSERGERYWFTPHATSLSLDAITNARADVQVLLDRIQTELHDDGRTEPPLALSQEQRGALRTLVETNAVPVVALALLSRGLEHTTLAEVHVQGTVPIPQHCATVNAMFAFVAKWKARDKAQQRRDRYGPRRK